MEGVAKFGVILVANDRLVSDFVDRFAVGCKSAALENA